MDCVMRTGQFKSLVTKNAVQAGYKLAIDSAEAIPFLNGVIADTKDILDPDNQGRTNFDASRPCPPTPLRVAAYTAGGGKHTFVPELTPAQGNTYVVAPHIIETDKLKFANWILSVNEDSDVKAELAAACNGDGCTLLGLSMLNFAKTADARDVTLVVTQFKKIVAESHPGPVNAISFSAWWKRIKKARIQVPPKRRFSDDDMAQEIINVMNHDSSIRDLWEMKLEAASNPGDLTTVLKLARTMLRRRRVGEQIDEQNSPTRGSGGLALVAQLQALGVSAQTVREVEKKQVALAVTSPVHPAVPQVPRAPPDQRKPPPVRPEVNERVPLRPVRPATDTGTRVDRVEPPRDALGKIVGWIKGMPLCDCGGEHLYTTPTCPLKQEKCSDSIKKLGAANKAKRMAEREQRGKANKQQANVVEMCYDSDEVATEDDGSHVAHIAPNLSDEAFEAQMKDFFAGLGDTIPVPPTGQAANVVELISPPEPIPMGLPVGLTTPSQRTAARTAADAAVAAAAAAVAAADAEEEVARKKFHTTLDQIKVQTIGVPIDSPKFYAIGVTGGPRIVFGTWADVAPLTTGSAAHGITAVKSFSVEADALAHMLGQGFALPQYVLTDTRPAKLASVSLAPGQATAATAPQSTAHPPQADSDPVAAPHVAPASFFKRNHFYMFAVLVAILAVTFAASTAPAFSLSLTGSLPLGSTVDLATPHRFQGALDSPLASPPPNPDQIANAVLHAITDHPPSPASWQPFWVAYALVGVIGALAYHVSLHSIWSLYVCCRWPRDVLATLALGASAVIFYLVGTKRTQSIIGSPAGGRMWKRSIASANTVSTLQATPIIAAVLALSSGFVGPPSANSLSVATTSPSTPLSLSPSSNASSPLEPTSFSSTVRVDLPYTGKWSPSMATTPVDSFIHHPGALHDNIANITDNINPSNMVATRVNRKYIANAAIIEMSPDSACTASLTPHCSDLTNTKECHEIFGSANGFVTRCTMVGDMPVYAHAIDTNGNKSVIQFHFTNVRCVPSFKYTLLSVDQIWEEQHITARFQDDRHLQLPASAGGFTIPYTPNRKLFTLSLISAVPRRAAQSAGRQPAPPSHGLQQAMVGFHAPASVAHVAKLSASQAGELMHRRWHCGPGFIQSLVNTARDAPANLTACPPHSCVHCAAAHIKKTAHSGQLGEAPRTPGKIHIDVKGPFKRSMKGFHYAVFMIDEYSRYVWVRFCKNKAEVPQSVVLMRAAFNAEVGTPVDETGKPLQKPQVFEVRSDHEGGLESHAFTAFRAEAGIHSTMSAPYDHDLNGIAERIIGVISENATATKSASGAPISVWPEMIRDVVDKHNCLAGALGSSSADSQISAYQRFRLRRPKVMDLITFGCRAVVLKSSPKITKGELNPRGWVGCWLGRRAGDIDNYEIWCPETNSVQNGSSCLVDEEYLPWLGKAAHQPLQPATSKAASTRVPPEPLGGEKPGSITSPPPFLLNLFSGKFNAANNVADRIRTFGWSVEEVDNHKTDGGGWASDVLNDEKYSDLKAKADAGKIDGMQIAFPCTTGSIARHFESSPPGPPPVRNRDHPDGLPADQLHPQHAKELAEAELLLSRTVTIALAARNSTSKATIIFENPADRSIVGSNQHSKELEMHGSIFATTQFKRLLAGLEETGGYSSCTFAYCRLGDTKQKYTTLYYTNDAAPVLDALNEPRFQCDHERGAHKDKAGGRAEDGSWLSAPAAAYPDQLVVRLCMAFTLARTGDVRPIADQVATLGLTTKPLPDAAPSQHTVTPEHVAFVHPIPASVGIDNTASPGRVDATPIAFRGFASPVPSTPPNTPPPPLHTAISLGRGVPIVPKALPIQGMRDRSTRQTILDQRKPAAVPLPTIPGSPASPSYVPFQPFSPSGSDYVGDMEANVAELISDSTGDDIPAFLPVGDWIDIPNNFNHDACIAYSDGSFVCDASLEHVHGAMMAASSEAAHAALLAYSEGIAGSPRPRVPRAQWQHELGLRADSAGAPSGFHEAMAWGGPWPDAIAKELGNHAANGSWEKIPLWQLPPGRRLTKLVWVSKVKRDGSAKMRLCVQGCTMVDGIDFDQTFSSALRTASARTIFAAAARYGLTIRSVDLVAAYLQGLLTEGEVVYCHLPPGSEEKGHCLKIIKPIYGMPQSGRRLQRLLVPWHTDTMKLRRLDDSDDCVYVYDRPDGSTERFIVGIYVDNLQIATSVELDKNGNAVDKNSFYAKYMEQVRRDWDVVDEGEMSDLLSIQVRRNDNGSITLHMANYINALLEKYLPNGPSPRVQEKSMPYSGEFDARIATALSLGSNSEPAYPELVKPFQQRLGSLMYLTTSCRADLAFNVSKLCTCMGRPTPDLMDEIDHTLSYLARHKHVGLTYSAGHEADRTKLQGMSDANWSTRFSTFGWVIKWQGAAIAWDSKKQDCVALSTCEAEIIALSEASKDMVYFRKLVTGIDPSAISGPSDLATDNKGAQDTSYNSEHHSRMKHVKRRHFFVRDMVETFELRVPLVPTADNYSDFLTKSMKNATTFLKFRALVMNEPPRN